MSKNLILKSTRGDLDHDQIKRHLESQPDILRDPVGTETYLICGRPSSTHHRERERLSDPTRFPRCGLIKFTDQFIAVTQEMCDSEELRSAMEFVRWMWSHFDISVREDGYQDYTELCRREGVEALYPERIRNAPLPWADRLIKIGFFQDLDHGDIDGPSLEAKRADQPAPDEDRLAAYLDAGHLYIASPGFVEDMISDDEIMIGPPHLLTDGIYVWPGDLPYYVRTYHVRLPTAFVAHARANSFAMPADVDPSSLKL